MIKNKDITRNKLNNKGSALVTVVVVIAFITILATLILYLSVMNFQMKANDYRTKESFYDAEVPLEEIKLQMAVDMSSACEKAYIDLMAQYDVAGNASGRTAAYEGKVLEEIKAIWENRAKTTDPGGNVIYDWALAIRKAIGDTSTDDYCVISGDSSVVECTDDDCNCQYHIILQDLPSGSERISYDGSSATFYDVKVVYTDESTGFTSIITTDFCFLVPELDWGMDGYVGAWNASDDTADKRNALLQRTQIDYEKCVVFLNYSKQ